MDIETDAIGCDTYRALHSADSLVGIATAMHAACWRIHVFGGGLGCSEIARHKRHIRCESYCQHQPIVSYSNHSHFYSFFVNVFRKWILINEFLWHNQLASVLLFFRRFSC